MSANETPFTKGVCTACGGHVEFPTEALGLTAGCPHCGNQTKMLANLPPVLSLPPATAPGIKRDPAAPAKAPAKFSTECPGCGLEVSVKAEACPSCGAAIGERSQLTWKHVLVSLAAIAVLGGGALALQRGGLWPSKKPPLKPPEFKQPPKPVKTPVLAGNAPPPAARAPVPVEVKRSGKFKVVDHQIERVAGRSLAYVVGHVTNDTEQQQFSVKITFELTSKSGKAAGTATDYASVIEPGGGWQFRALILETNVASAKLVSLEAEKP